MGKCPNCGAPMVDRRCEYCGYNVVAENNHSSVHNYYFFEKERKSRKNKVIAFILCFFFGISGVHYFYVGRFGKGLLYFFTGGLFSIGWILDIFSIASGNFKDADGLLLK